MPILFRSLQFIQINSCQKKKKKGKNDQPEVQVKGMATFNSLIQRELLKPYQHLISL